MPPGPASTGPGFGLPGSPFARLARDRHGLGSVFVRSPVPMAVVDGTGRVLDANPALAAYLGHEATGLVGTDLHDHLADDDPGRLSLGIADRRLRHARGHDVWAAVTVVPLPEAAPDALLVCVDDATGRRNTERMLLHAALHDSLTNLPNRRLLRDRLDTALTRSQRTAARVAVLFIDLDRFKEVNDSLGHDAGDAVLVSVANGLMGALRAGDTVSRLGGDEFVVVCDDVATELDLSALVDRLRLGIGRPVRVRDRTIAMSASVGVALAGPGATTADELLRLADLAMLRAKRRPDLPYVVAGPDPADPLGDRPNGGPDLLTQLRTAIQSDLLSLHYQPVVRPDGHLLGLEALLRWRHPRRGLLLPEDLLPRVAGTDLATSLSDWVLRAAVSDAATWHDPRLRVSVNVSAVELARPGFADNVAALLDWAGLAPRGLYIEMPERDLPEAGPGLADQMEQLRRLGVGVAIDGFGSGGTPLSGLRLLPVDTVKVGRDVVAGCTEDPEDGAVVAAVATAARAAGRHPLASGVETPAQLHLLRDLGYESVQGYLIGAPAPLIDLREVIDNRRVDLPH